MLEITKVEKASRDCLGTRKWNPLSHVFNITAKCLISEVIDGEVMGSNYTQTIESGQDYQLLVEFRNVLKQAPLQTGDMFFLETLQNNKHILVLNDNTPFVWRS